MGDAERGTETVMASLVQLYAYCFAGFKTRWTATITILSILSSLYGCSGYIVQVVDLDFQQMELDRVQRGTEEQEIRLSFRLICLSRFAAILWLAVLVCLLIEWIREHR